MDNRDDVREFLTSRRARITPQQAGLPVYGTNRRVPGLRREEVALLAGVSIDYYTQLERGKMSGVSETVLDAIARALQLNDAERAHLYDLARAANTPSRPRRKPAPKVRPGLQRMIDALVDAPAIIRNGRMDILATNQLGHAMYWPVFHSADPGPTRPANIARFQFLNPTATDFFPDWTRAADITVALLRTEAGRDPYDRNLSDLIGELSTRSDDFRTRWAAHNVRRHHNGTKTFHHPAVGDLTLDYESIDMPAEHHLNLTVYTATPDTPTHDTLRLLASWAATHLTPAPHDTADPRHAVDQSPS